MVIYCACVILFEGVKLYGFSIHHAGTLSNRALKNNRKLVIRFLVGAWCLSCFVILTAYSSVLVSFLNAPDDSFSAIVNSVNDLPMKPDIRVTVDKGLIADILFKVFSIRYELAFLKKLSNLY